jgi:hypothetical protein
MMLAHKALRLTTIIALACTLYVAVFIVGRSVWSFV